MLVALSSIASAQGFTPTTKTVEIVVPYPPGGATDKWARVLDEIFQAQGWKSVVLNKPGADTVIGSNYVAAARPDGHTIYVGGNGFIDANIAFRQRAPGIEYTENSFAPIISLGAGTAVLAVANNVPVNTYEEFKEYVKKNPEKFNLGFWNTTLATSFMSGPSAKAYHDPTLFSTKVQHRKWLTY
jgi:tripartite-type tricarboxylate transporter receptor subunit TctC